MVIAHELAPHYAALRAIRRRRTLLRSPLWREIGAEVERVCCAVEVEGHAESRPRPLDGLRALAWNIQRGRDFDGILTALRAHPADVVILVEVDCGMARSGNRHVARELAAALGMSYAFGVSYLALEDDFGENPEGKPNGLALAGTAILSRLPIARATSVDLPELRDKFSSSEKRLGRKRALAVELALDDGPLTLGAAHLDSNASPAGRARQLAALLDCVDAPRVLVGGDLNTTTYDVQSPLRLLWNILHKLFVNGFAGTIAHYMTPERHYERALFAELARRRFVVEGFNDRARGTMTYDFSDAYALQKTREAVGDLLTRLLVRKLRPWNGVVPARLDWFAGRGVGARNPGVLTVPRVSDHSPITVELSC